MVKTIIVRLSVFSSVLILSSAGSVFALPTVHGKPHPHGVRDGVSKKPDPIKLRRMGYSAPEIRKAIGSEGTKKLAAIYINFPSADSTTSGSPTIQDTTKIMTYISSMTHFFNEASYGKLNLVISTFSATPASSPMQNYAASAASLIVEAILGSPASVNSSNYDAVMIVHAGYGYESSAAPGDIYSAFYPQLPSTRGFTEGFVVPEFQSGTLSPFGVYVHEMGHQLGLPDLYSTDSVTGGTRIGKWCLMDYGPWSNNGHNPSHISAWGRYNRGWTELSTVTARGEFIVGPASSSNTIVKIPVDVASDPASEYFLVEYRKKDDPKASYDKGLPGSGVLIWHIDESQGSFEANDVNNYETLRVALKYADSTSPADNKGDATDPWPGTKITFTDPDSRAHNGMASGIIAASFSLYTASAVFSVDKLASAPLLSIARIVNYPNPAGKNQFHPRGALTTINFKLTRPARDVNLAVYSITGDRILNVPKNSLNIRLAPDPAVNPASVGASSDENWIYEFDWDGKDSGGAPVAPGVYIYRIRADGQVKTGKMVVER